MKKFFVTIAAYRDPELATTVADMLTKAKHPDRLRICVINQDVAPLKTEGITELFVPWQQSKGLCWARSTIRKMYNGEPYGLQLDSHHRFAPGWDYELEAMMDSLPEKSVLGSYCPGYTPGQQGFNHYSPFEMVADKFTDYGTILFRPSYIKGWQELQEPIPACYMSGHFCFSRGQHVAEYRYDPNIYFAGDEISLSVRSWTMGYDLYAPHIPVIWHEYTRNGRPKHWDDHPSWGQTNAAGLKRLRQMLRMENNHIDLAGFGLGTARRLEAWEELAGVSLKNRTVNRDGAKFRWHVETPLKPGAIKLEVKSQDGVTLYITEKPSPVTVVVSEKKPYIYALYTSEKKYIGHVGNNLTAHKDCNCANA